ncbi:hypothetical protein J6590_096790 [Homalodisca vitripennis]|nr:hypothetical protein J6590_096790 [Homalodisca vitripennis]
MSNRMTSVENHGTVSPSLSEECNVESIRRAEIGRHTDSLRRYSRRCGDRHCSVTQVSSIRKAEIGRPIDYLSGAAGGNAADRHVQ